MASRNQRDVDFGAKVPPDLYAEFKFLFPQYGATTWFINTVLEQFIKTVRDNHTLQELVALSIEAMLVDRRSEAE